MEMEITNAFLLLVQNLSLLRLMSCTMCVDVHICHS